MRFMILATLLFAQSPIDPTGHWEGIVQIPEAQIKIEIDLAKDGNGNLVGAFAQPAENLKGLPLANFSTEGASLSFQIKGKAGERLFAGKLSADGTSMSGEFTQNGYQMPFTLTRTGDARFESPAKLASIGKQLEGSWNATLNASGTDVHLVLTLANQPDGSGTANVVNMDDGLEIPVTTLTQVAANLTLEFKAIGGSYAGAVNPEGTMLVGTFTQRGKTAPLTFQRAGK